MNQVSYTGDGKTCEFHFNFPFFKDTDVRVFVNGQIVTDEIGITKIESGSDSDIPYSGGIVYFAYAPNSGSTITIDRRIKLERDIDYQPTLPIGTTNLNRDLNFCVEALKDLYSVLENVPGLTEVIALGEQITNLPNLSELAKLSDISPLSTAIATLDTDKANKNLSNIPSEYDYVSASGGTPTAWYRKHKSGWCEQGGYVASVTSSGANIVLPITMVDANYTVIISAYKNAAVGDSCYIRYTPTTTGFGVKNLSGDFVDRIYWRVSGFCTV